MGRRSSSYCAGQTSGRRCSTFPIHRSGLRRRGNKAHNKPSPIDAVEPQVATAAFTARHVKTIFFAMSVKSLPYKIIIIDYSLTNCLFAYENSLSMEKEFKVPTAKYGLPSRPVWQSPAKMAAVAITTTRHAGILDANPSRPIQRATSLCFVIYFQNCVRGIS